MSTNKFDKKILEKITPDGAKTMSEKKKTPTDSLPTTPDETQEEEVKREITVLINGKRLQLVEVDGDIHFADKDVGHGLSVTKKGDMIIVAGAGGNGNACGGRFLINARGGQWYKGGAIIQEASADESEGTGTNGDSSTQESQSSTGKTDTTQAGKTGVACSQMFYGDHIEECQGNVHIRARNITLDAIETLTLMAGEQISIQAGPKGGGNLDMRSGQINVETDTYVEKITANKIIDGTPETTRLGYDPRTNESTLGWYNLNSNITGDYKLAVGGCMEVTVAGAPPPVPTNALILNRTVGYSLTVALGSMNLSTIAGSALIAIGGLAFPDEDSLKPGSLDIKAMTSVGISAAEVPELPSAPSAGDINIRSLTKVDIEATTDVNIKAKKDINVEADTGDISILATAGKIYLN